MGTSSEVSLAHHRDIYHYYVSLKTFFEVTGENRDRSNSTRAQKARAKLLKLSSSQFYELSTDVSDELQRRIGEDANQPDYLLPRANFHMKRNQARQKLANLSQTRFNDLLDDILFEIKRRGFNKDLDSPPPPPPQPQLTKQEVVRDSDDSAKTSTNSPKAQVAPNVSVQPSLVIPKMASIDWSSEEEEEAEEAKAKAKELENEKANTDEKEEAKPALEPIVTESAVPDSQVLVHDITSMVKTPTTTQKNYWDVNDSPIIKVDNDIDNDKDGEQLKSPETPNLEDDNSSSVMEDRIKELTDLNSDLHSQIEDLNARLVSLTNEMEKKKDSTSNHTIDESFQKELLLLNSQIGELSIENENLKQKISESELSQKKNDSNHDLKITDVFISKYSSVDGLIPVQYILNASNLITQFTTRLSAVGTGRSAATSHHMGKELFQILSQLSNLVSQLLFSADLLQYKDQIILLKASLSHAITSIRYFSVYGPVLVPKITVQAAISEISFAICNLIDSAKIKSDSVVNNTMTSEDNRQMLEYSPQIATTPMTPTFPTDPSSTINMKKEFTNPHESAFFLNDVEEEESPVKPLKITQKAINSPIIKPSSNMIPTTSRKPSGTGLFSLMIDSSTAKNNSHKDDDDKYVSPIKPATSASNSTSNNGSEIPKLTLPPQIDVYSTIVPSENRIPNIKIENSEEGQEKSANTTDTAPTTGLTSSIADKLKRFDQNAENKLLMKENSTTSEQSKSKPNLSNKFISSMNDVSTDEDSNSDANNDNDEDDDDDFTYMALKQTMKREGSKIARKNDHESSAKKIELDMNSSPESVKITSPELVRKIASPEAVKKTGLPESADKAASPDVLKKIVFPEAIEKTTPPETVSKTALPEAVKKMASSSETVSKTALPEVINKTTSPETVSKTALPEAVKKMGSSPEAISNTALPEAIKKATSPEAIKKTAPSEVLKNNIFPKAISKTEPSEASMDTRSSEVKEKNASPQVLKKIIFPVPTGKMASPEVIKKTAPTEAIKKTNYLPDINKSYTETATLIEPTNMDTEDMDLNTSRTDVDSSSSMKQEEDDEEKEEAFNQVKSASQIITSEEEEGEEDDFNNVRNDYKAESVPQKHNAREDLNEVPNGFKVKGTTQAGIAREDLNEDFNEVPNGFKVKGATQTGIAHEDLNEDFNEVPNGFKMKGTTQTDIAREDLNKISNGYKAKSIPQVYISHEDLNEVSNGYEAKDIAQTHIAQTHIAGDDFNKVPSGYKAKGTTQRDIAQEDLNEVPYGHTAKGTTQKDIAQEDLNEVPYGHSAEGTTQTYVAQTHVSREELNEVPNGYKAKGIAQSHIAGDDFNKVPNGYEANNVAQAYIGEEKHGLINSIENTQAKKSNHVPNSSNKLVTGGKPKLNDGAPNSVSMKNVSGIVAHHEDHDSDDDDSSYQFIPMRHEGQQRKQVVMDESEEEEEEESEEEEDEDEEEDSDFDVDTFDIENPDNTLSELLLYLEHQTMDVISTIQSLLTSIKKPQATKGNLRGESNAINQVIGQMVDATSISMQQSRNANLKKHGDWVVQSLRDCSRRMTILCQLTSNGVLTRDNNDEDYADKNFKQRLAGIAFDVAKCTKELVKTVEEASLKDEISYLNSRLK